MAYLPFHGWMMLDRFVRRREGGSFPAGDPTAASLTNSRGDPFDVCLSLMPPPEPSFLSLRWPDGPAEGEPAEPAAAHGGAILLLMHYTVPVRACGGLPFPMIDYFVYDPAAPSLRRLPPLAGSIAEVEARAAAERLHLTKQTARRMESRDVGIIHRGPGDFAVAELQIVADEDKAWPELRVFNPSVSDQWVLTRPCVVPVRPRDDLDMDHLLWYWDTDAVVPFGTWLCWADYTAGVMLCNVFGGGSEILFLELPIKHPCYVRDLSGRGWLEAYHALGATKRGDILKFARVLPDDPPSPNGIVLPVYHPFPNRFTVTTWSLRLASGNMVWQEESSVTADQLRDLVEFDHLPRELLTYPTFDLFNLDVVTFVLKKDDGTYNVGEIWLVAINVMKKTVKSSMLYIKDYEDSIPEETELFARKIWYFEPFLPLEISKNVNLYKSAYYQGLASGGHASKRKLCYADVPSGSLEARRPLC